MNRTAAAVVAAGLLAGCAAPGQKPAGPPPCPPSGPFRPGPTSAPRRTCASRGRAAATRWRWTRARSCRSRLTRKAIVHQGGGAYEALAGPGAWLVATHSSRFRILEHGAVVPADKTATSLPPTEAGGGGGGRVPGCPLR